LLLRRLKCNLKWQRAKELIEKQVAHAG
jgi:hypothetical protein